MRRIALLLFLLTAPQARAAMMLACEGSASLNYRQRDFHSVIVIDNNNVRITGTVSGAYDVKLMADEALFFGLRERGHTAVGLVNRITGEFALMDDSHGKRIRLYGRCQPAKQAVLIANGFANQLAKTRREGAV
jgi:hypothetical protein